MKKYEKHQPKRFEETAEPEVMPMMLGLFDVLGFSNRIKQIGIHKIHELYESLIKNAVIDDGILSIGTHRYGDGTASPTVFTFQANFAFFSDTILLWSPLQPMFVGPFVQKCTNLFCEALLAEVPLRGAISIGEAILHRNSSTYLGEPIVEAARLEAAQNWIGLTLAPSSHWNDFVAELNPMQIIEYDPPLKDNYDNAKPIICIDWPRTWRESRKTSPNCHLEKMISAPEFEKYFRNAMDFCDFSEKNKDWHENPRPGARLTMGRHPIEEKKKEK